MDDTAALRRTLRRCTAVLVAVLGVIAAYSAPYGPDTSIGYPLSYAASAYLGLSLLVGLFRRAGEAGPDESRSSGDGGEGGGSDGTGGAESSGDDGEAADDDDEGTADGGETDHPPVSTFGGGHW
jgi:uncharacterized membrane protein YgcG